MKPMISAGVVTDGQASPKSPVLIMTF